MIPLLRRVFELQDARHARLLPMEGLRGCAVALVFLQHYGVQAQLIGLSPASAFLRNVAAEWRNIGNVGVDLFFVLSGYLIYGTLVRKAPRFIEFMYRRVERIYPTFLVVFAMTLVTIIATGAAERIPAEPVWATLYLAANLALLPGLFPIERLVSVAWSLSYEMFFYVTTAAVVLWAGLGRADRRQRIAVLAALSVVFVAVAALQWPGFPLRMMPFFAGMLLAEGLGERVPAWLGWAAPALAAVAAVLHVFPDLVWDELCWTVAFFALCGVAFRGAGRISAALTWAPLRWLGNMSYSFYLAHGIISRSAMVLIGRTLPGGMSDAAFWLWFPVVFVVALAGSAALFIVVEKPYSLRPNRGPVRQQLAA